MINVRYNPLEAFGTRQADISAVWASRCISHTPPIRPTAPTWSEIALHRQLMSIRPTPLSDDTNPDFTDDTDNDVSYDLDDRDMPGIHPPAMTVVTALPRGGFAGVRQNVWERTGLAHLPIFTSSPVKSSSSPPSSSQSGMDLVEPPISSYLVSQSPTPQVNYKHLYLAHRTISRRIRKGTGSSSGSEREKENGNTPVIVDAISSIEAGGLSGHSEAIYALALLRHPMRFTLNLSCATCEASTTAGAEGVMVSGRDWLLSGSRDKTMRLWQLDCPKPRVVKVFMGAHAGSVLSMYTIKVGSATPPRSPTHVEIGSHDNKERMLAVTGGSDGRICVWDLEGDGTAEKQVEAHADSVLCVKGDRERIVSCSKGNPRVPSLAIKADKQTVQSKYLTSTLWIY